MNGELSHVFCACTGLDIVCIIILNLYIGDPHLLNVYVTARFATADWLRSWHGRLARRSIEQAHAYYHAPFYTCAHALEGSVSGLSACRNCRALLPCLQSTVGAARWRNFHRSARN